MRRQRSISPNWAFEQMSCKSASNTAMPWRTWFSAVCQNLAVEMQRGVGVVEQLQCGLGGDGLFFNRSDITRREEAAPIEEAISRWAYCSN